MRGMAHRCVRRDVIQSRADPLLMHTSAFAPLNPSTIARLTAPHRREAVGRRLSIVGGRQTLDLAGTAADSSVKNWSAYASA